MKNGNANKIHSFFQIKAFIVPFLLILLLTSGCQYDATPTEIRKSPRTVESVMNSTQDQTELILPSSTRPVVLPASGSKTRICFTFDDGPDPKSTPRLLDVLKQYNVKATFFVIGYRAEANPKIISRMISEGHLLGNHTYSHPLNPDMTKLSDVQIEQEITKCDAVLKKITNITPPYFRAPGGAMNDRIVSLSGRPVIQWTIEGGDWHITDVNQIYDNIYNKINDGAIILMHDNHEESVDAVIKLLANLPKDQYDVIRLDELLAHTK